MRRRKLLAWRPVKRRLYFLVAVVWECVSIFSDTAGYNAPRCTQLFAFCNNSVINVPGV